MTKKMALVACLVLAFLSLGSVAHAQCDLNATTATFAAQLSALPGGQTLCLASGNYGSLGSVSKPSMVTITAAPGASVNFSTVAFSSGTQNITLQNVTIGDSSIAAANGQLPSTVNNVVFKNVVGNRLFIAAQNVQILGGDFGKVDPCKGGQEDGVQIWQIPDSSGNYHGSTNVLFDGASVHDVTDENGSCNGLHVDCIQILSGHNITVQNSRFWNCPTDDIIAQPFRDTLDNLLLQNNFFGNINHPGATLNFSYSGDSFNNAVVRDNVIDGNIGVACNAGACIKFYGNIITGLGSCGSNGTWDGNVFFPGTATCGTNAKVGTVQFVGPIPPPGYNPTGSVAPNYHLSPNDTVAINSGSLVSFAPTDIDGDARPAAFKPSGSKPDAGADERNSSPPPPQITVTVAPTAVTLAPSATQQFTATVTGTTNTAVAWSSTCGTISAIGLYTAPSTGPCTATAASIADATKTGSATITVTVAPPPTCTATSPITPTCNRISVISTANIRAVSCNNCLGMPLYGTEPAGALGTRLAVSTDAVPNIPGAVWVQVKFDTCSTSIPNCTGWMGSDNMRVSQTPPPAQPSLTANGCTKSASTFSCTWGFTNMPANTTATALGSAAGITVNQTITVP